MMPKRLFQKTLPPDADRAEMAEFLADMIEHLVKHKREALTKAGISETELFNMKRAAKAYRDDALTPADFKTMQGLIEKLDAVEIYL